MHPEVDPEEPQLQRRDVPRRGSLRFKDTGVSSRAQFMNLRGALRVHWERVQSCTSSFLTLTMVECGGQ
jgi:hypothetical protein